MTLSIEEVEHIAELAKLELTQEEKQLYADQLSAILDYANRLQQIDTGDIPPTASVLPVDTVLRPDEAQDSIPRDILLANAAGKEDGMFKVDVILEEE